MTHSSGGAPSPADFRLDALILAAGRGTRMPSPRPKVLQTLLGETMLGLVYASVASLPEVDRVLTLVGHEADMVRAEAARCARRGPRPAGESRGEALCVEQTEQLGTGHALMCALPALEEGCGHVLVVNGDTPLLPSAALSRFVSGARGADLAFATLCLDDPGAFGRVVRDKAGGVAAIVEARDYDEARHGRDPHEINAGVYLLRVETARRLLPRLTNRNTSGEYYITDLAALAVAEGMSVLGLPVPADSGAWLGVNTPAELAAAEEHLRRRRVAELLSAGVLLHAPESVRVSPFAVVEPGAELCGPCEIYGDSRVAGGALVESHCVLCNAEVGPGARVRSFCHLESAEVGPACQVGPYARLRPGAVMEENSHAGNFVEMKKARLGKGSKANHLTYLGDAEVGPGVNVGAGTITCNYDGKNKHRTVIEAGAFIGSNTALVAPVTVGENALVGAGSVITKDVPREVLAVGRGRQVNLPRRA
ncbi:MAG: bifunctional UDP-N-acetylglucosamine diphosphorylase/glucosamine-1-phosphate N-acetyltransferase GlmU [Desulfovibrionaceae bacterium]|nr:bifunctional UDP-N-acetylglucosamine diphosphorylase/glucosamine-1-phosphate N-acetyltransferase GlmU [Desulfovibrionaceae bacterium]